jgi:4-amino-4-deoxy-L-arabinose transferase-like glycosyltransferase
MTPPALQTGLDPTRRREWSAIATATLFGAVIRLWDFPGLGLVHFDEGIYALGGLWVESPEGLLGISTETIPYSPPLYPILVGLAYLVLGRGDYAAILPALLAGIATIPALGWLGRRTFGPGAGAAASGLLSLYGPQIAFSRMALTDSTFLLAWVIAIGLGMRFLERPGFARAVAFGLAVGVAQNAKYNGVLSGLAVAIAAATGLARSDRRRAIASIAWGVLALAVALVAYLPWYAFVEAHFGYASLVRHHRGYLSGVERWPDHWRVQMAQAVALSGQLWRDVGMGALAWPLAWVGASYARNGARLAASMGRLAWGWWAVGLGLGACALGILPMAPWWVALALLPTLLVSREPSSRVVGAWWAILAVLTPFYHPYARLMLPLEAAGLLVLARFAAQDVRAGSEAEGAPGRPLRHVPVAAGLLMAAATVVLGMPESRPWPGLLARSDGLRLAVDRVIAEAAEARTPPSGLRTLVRPSALFYLALRYPSRLTREADLAGLRMPRLPGAWVLVDEEVASFSGGPRLSDDPSWRRVLQAEFATNIPTRLDRAPASALGPGPSPSGEDAVVPDADRPSRLLLVRPLR